MSFRFPGRCRYWARSWRGASCAPSSFCRAVASCGDRFREAEVCTASTFGSSSVGFLDSFCATTRSGSSLSVGTSFGTSVALTSAFCSASAGEATDASASGPGGKSVSSACGDSSSTPTSIACAPKGIAGIAVLHMRDCQRHAAEMKRQRGYGRENPEPPGRLLLGIEVGLSDIAALKAWGFRDAAAVGRRHPARLRARPASSR